jgi:nucleoside-diphosphate kinase
MNTEELEQTLVLIKPDALKNSLTGYVLSQLSEFHTGLRFAAAKIVQVSKMLAEEHYLEHRGKPFYPSLLEYIQGCAHYSKPEDAWKRRVVAIVYHGPNAVQKVRDFCGPTNPHIAREEKPGCIRALGTLTPIMDEAGQKVSERMDNLIHASAKPVEAEREVKLWFKPNDMPPLMRAYATRLSQDHYYFKGGQLYKTYKPGSICLLAPGDVAWQSDLDALELLYQGKPSGECSVEAVAAKYLINEDGQRTSA